MSRRRPLRQRPPPPLGRQQPRFRGPPPRFAAPGGIGLRRALPPLQSTIPGVPPGISPPRQFIKGRDVSIQHTARENISTQFSAMGPSNLSIPRPQDSLTLRPRAMFRPTFQPPNQFDFTTFWKTLFTLLASRSRRKKEKNNRQEECGRCDQCGQCINQSNQCNQSNAVCSNAAPPHIRSDNGGPYQKVKSWYTKGSDKYPPVKVIEKTSFYPPNTYDQRRPNC